MNKKNRFGARLALPALIAAILAPAAHAAGFQLSEQSIVGLGRAHAGAGVAGDDLSSVFYNPAGMVLHRGTQIQGGLTYAEIDAPFEGDNSFYLSGARSGTNNGRGPGEVIPQGFLIKEINERTRFGFGVTVPFGLGSSYGDDWFGRNHGIEAHIMTVDFNPSLAYQLDEQWSIGGGVSAQYAKAKLKQGAFFPGASGEIDADSWAFGYNLGVMYQFDADTRVGLSYRSKLQHDAEGDYTAQGFDKFLGGLKIDGVYDGAASVTTPESVLLSAYHRVNPKLALTGSLRWSNWSRFDKLTIEGNPLSDTTIDNNWKGSWFASVGADYSYSDKLTLRGGVGYETSPVPDAEHRNPLIPDRDRVWLSVGGSYALEKNMTLDVGYTYLLGVGDDKIDHTVMSPATPGKPNGNPDTLKGKYNSITGHLIGVGLQYRF
ncbi:OmpP1/FadL family transporter [Crenobacter intestini]|uniref:OmpP1/FadL family transporter n=1 Tax=Crenobacter intestini TaxID=2563443 RepID=UPI0014586857|nr:porin [Crenobacter intestini]